MNILGIETATERLSAALLLDGTIHERHTDSRSSHCELLTGFIIELTEKAGITLHDLDGIAVSSGPGSFTGLRIGIATAMGLAYGLGVKTVGINTLMGLARNALLPGTLICPLIDARRSEVFTALYRTADSDSIPDTVMKSCAVSLPKLAGILESQNEPITITGPYIEKFRKPLEEMTGIPVSSIPAELSKPSAAAIVVIGAIMFRNGSGISPAALEPLYLRRSDAEIARDTRQ